MDIHGNISPKREAEAECVRMAVQFPEDSIPETTVDVIECRIGQHGGFSSSPG